MSKQNDIPGPGTYTPRDKSAVVEPPSYKIGIKTSLISSKDISPGPGAYNQSQLFSKSSGMNGGGASIKGRYSSKDKRNVPGPGSYVLRSSFEQPMRSGKIGTAKRDSITG